MSAALSGPIGQHARSGRSWWTPVRVLVAVTSIVFSLGLLQKAPCEASEWSGQTPTFTHLCYSDIGYLYSGRGFAAGVVPYAGNGDGRYPYFEYPVLIGAFAYGASLVTHALVAQPDLSTTPVGRIGSIPAVEHGAATYFAVTAIGLFGCALVAVCALAGVHRRRPWDAMLVATAPTLALAATINWDLVAVAFVCGALLAWSRSRPLLTGVLIGLGTATKLYPVFLLGALLLVCLRAGQLRAFGWAALGAVGAWLAVNLPVIVFAPAGWTMFWTYNQSRGGEWGSFWFAFHQLSPSTINALLLVGFGSACAAIGAIALRAERRPRVPQLAFLIVGSFVLLNKVYSPQYVLWLLPLAAYARPRWRDLLIWQAAEIFYFVMIWLYLGGMLTPAGGGPSVLYGCAIAVHIGATACLMAVVLRDIWLPWHDPVRADAVTDDPAGGVVDGAEDSRGRWGSGRFAPAG
jgi:uncharacterized membrane protein